MFIEWWHMIDLSKVKVKGHSRGIMSYHVKNCKTLLLPQFKLDHYESWSVWWLTSAAYGLFRNFGWEPFGGHFGPIAWNVALFSVTFWSWDGPWMSLWEVQGICLHKPLRSCWIAYSVKGWSDKFIMTEQHTCTSWTCENVSWLAEGITAGSSLYPDWLKTVGDLEWELGLAVLGNGLLKGHYVIQTVLGELLWSCMSMVDHAGLVWNMLNALPPGVQIWWSLKLVIIIGYQCYI